MEDDKTEDDQNGRQPKWKMTKMDDDHSSLAAAAGDSRINSSAAMQSAHTQTDETKK